MDYKSSCVTTLMQIPEATLNKDRRLVFPQDDVGADEEGGTCGSGAWSAERGRSFAAISGGTGIRTWSRKR
jgi:hypothetical protein